MMSGGPAPEPGKKKPPEPDLRANDHVQIVATPGIPNSHFADAKGLGDSFVFDGCEGLLLGFGWHRGIKMGRVRVVTRGREGDCGFYVQSLRVVSRPPEQGK